MYMYLVFYFSGQFSAGDIAGIAIGSTIGFWFAVLIIVALILSIVCFLRRYHSNKGISPGEYMYICPNATLCVTCSCTISHCIIH